MSKIHKVALTSLRTIIFEIIDAALLKVTSIMCDSVIVTSRQLCFQMSARNDRRQRLYVSFTMPDNRLRLVYDDKFQEFGASFPSQTVYTYPCHLYNACSWKAGGGSTQCLVQKCKKKLLGICRHIYDGKGTPVMIIKLSRSFLGLVAM